MEIKKLAINIFCWFVKIAGITIFLLITAIAVGEGQPNPFKLPVRELLMFVFVLTIWVGLALALWQQWLGGLVILVGIVSVTAVHGIQHNWLFHAFWILGLLNIFCWRLKKSGKGLKNEPKIA
ncbi:MAG: hypothetical protein PHF37_06580 [Phycisphaerae bacterium]|nr:hypothetical protein [Phycisphaerae bacterium]